MGEFCSLTLAHEEIWPTEDPWGDVDPGLTEAEVAWLARNGLLIEGELYAQAGPREWGTVPARRPEQGAMALEEA